ncbi:pyridoxamine 5'-phosphate oxidase family protein [Cohnella pontilimi]|uniref:Pyridoxamine 5'-phosphate oxidase family protein n=1 Tax=Cohnella pontilimi TaxID=2564100 RepID=A0A4U0FCE0_9BACL|nr:pyridoxamine 5'-phosphate oxidase family protein [Cohnella pontilimi]TJY42455.1 pyridoxamine 5'-phosphate oxidase family protein [Cohnella pontilimi]
MGSTFQSILPEHETFINEQRMFFVGTAASNGHVNISPKGHDVLRILSPNKVAYLDLTGSGNETSAHLSESNRITFMFVSFQGKPLILRLYGNGKVILPNSEEWREVVTYFNLLPGYRQIIISEIDCVKTSCGFSVPLYSFEGERNLLIEWATNKGEEGLNQYRKNKNSISMDGIITPIGKSLIEEV